MRRMDRYKEEDINKSSRTDINQELYQNVSSNAIYTNITDVTNANAFEISSQSAQGTTREAYQQMQKYQTMEPVPKTRKDLDDFNYLYQNKENKIYDINSFLEEARKKRIEKDEKEEKRKLKNNDYNILSDVNKEKLEQYREEKKKRIMTPEEEELIDTIVSKTLAGEIDKATSVDLLSDLMATNLLDTVSGSEEISAETEEVAEEEPTIIKTETKIEIPKEEVKEETTETEEVQPAPAEDTEKVEEDKQENTTEDALKGKDPDFYTRSMDLSDKDFNMSDDFKEKQLSLPMKIFIFLLILAVIAVSSYFIYKRIL